MQASQPLLEAAYAVAIGLVVGFEREHAGTSDAGDGKKVDAASVLGARTFALIALGGWLAAYLGDRHTLVVPLGIVGLASLLSVQYVMAVRAGQGTGITTEVAALVVALLGMVVHFDRALAVPITLATLLLLVAKPWTSRAVSQLKRVEITATVQLLVLVAIVLPILPAEPVDPWDAIPPRKVGVFVVLIAAVEYVGYVLHRLLGATRGVVVAGLVGGLTSSTAVTAAMARQARQAPASSDTAQLAVFLANAVMCVRVVVVTAVLQPDVAWAVAAPLGALLAVLLAASVWRGLALRRGDGGAIEEGALALRNPFAVVPALTWGAVLCGVLLVAHFATEHLGSQGLILAAAATGLADVDAIVLAAAREVEAGVAADYAAIAIVVAVASNTIVKAGIAVVGGGRAFGTRIATVFGVGLAVGAAVAVAQWLA